MFFSENNLNNEIRNILKLKELFDTKTCNYELLCIFQEVRGYQSKKEFKCKNINFIQISTIDKNNGVEFICEKDEEYFKSILIGQCSFF
jgi:hypothetical protein